MATSTSFTYVIKPCVWMLDNPQKDSKTASQVRYGERIIIEKTEDNWSLIRNCSDNYEGWVKSKKKNFRSFNSDQFLPESPIVKTNSLISHIFPINDTEIRPIISLPSRSPLKIIKELEEQNYRWICVELLLVSKNKSQKSDLSSNTDTFLTGYVQRGDLLPQNQGLLLDHELINFSQKPFSLEEMISYSKDFIGVAYVFGGRSTILGFDCSGFIQFLLERMNIFIPRDTKDQIKWEGFEPVDMKNLKPGDLIFWGINENKICHVGLFIGNDQFIHAGIKEQCPRIKISQLSENDWNGSQTSRLKYRVARRLKLDLLLK